MTIACTLSAGQLARRRHDLAALATRALLTRSPIEGGERLTFAATPQNERDLRATVAAEASCCAFLTMDLRRRDGALVLDVTAPAEGRPVIAELFA